MHIHHMDPAGGFTCGDTETGHTVYAYPSSEHATTAKRDPAKVAAEMLQQANYLNPLLPGDIVASANLRNWPVLNNARWSAAA